MNAVVRVAKELLIANDYGFCLMKGTVPGTRDEPRCPAWVGNGVSPA